jgi:uncharacterized protein YodC (DUF2158 family)
MKFKTGDVVRLKSGGAWMTVKEYVENKVTCCWNSENTPHQENYLEEMLESKEIFESESNSDEGIFEDNNKSGLSSYIV